eukprot:5842543-Amphidinium_carterae.3
MSQRGQLRGKTHPCSGSVSMEAVQVQRDIYIDDITIFEWPARRFNSNECGKDAHSIDNTSKS